MGRNLRTNGRKLGNPVPKSVENLVAGMSEDSRSLLERTHSLVDCKVRAADGVEFELHKMTLTQDGVTGAGVRPSTMRGGGTYVRTPVVHAIQKPSASPKLIGD